MRKLSDTFLYKMLDKSNNITEQINSISLPVNVLSKDKLNFYIEIIKRRFNYALKSKVIKDFEDGLVVPVFNEEIINIPHFIPAVGIINDSVAKSYVNLTNYGKMSKDGSFDIDGRKLFTCLQTGTLLRECAVYRWNQISMNTTILKNSSLIYTKLFCKVLDKMFAINLNKQRTDITSYCVAKFFLIYVMEKSPGENINSIAYLSCYNDITKTSILSSDELFEKDAYLSFDNFIKNLSTLDGLNGLTMRGFLENWMKMYDNSTVTALEYYPYFLHMIFSAMINSHINAEYIIESLSTKETALLYSELARIIR